MRSDGAARLAWQSGATYVLELRDAPGRRRGEFGEYGEWQWAVAARVGEGCTPAVRAGVCVVPVRGMRAPVRGACAPCAPGRGACGEAARGDETSGVYVRVERECRVCASVRYVGDELLVHEVRGSP